MKWWNQDRLARAQAVIGAPTNNFAELFKIAGLDESVHLRNTDLSHLSFSGCDLRGFDFSGARLHECNFRNALIDGARFDQAEINGANLTAAKDWDAHVRSWRRKVQPSNDAYLPEGAAFLDAPFAPELVVIPSGRFLMGSADEEEGRYDDEGPPHEVTIPHRLAVGRFPVTFEEWDFAMADGGMKRYRPGDQVWGRGRRPVINVSWKDARAYVAWLCRKTGQTYRLLSEAEWEYCCRAGSMARYSLGNDEEALGEYAWYHENSGGKTHPVGEKKPNTWGLYDMHGNVWEWCEDGWHESYKEKPEELNANGGAWTTRGGRLHVVRGGSWFNFPRNLRSAYRNGYVAGIRYNDSGFRVARTLTS